MTTPTRAKRTTSLRLDRHSWSALVLLVGLAGCGAAPSETRATALPITVTERSPVGGDVIRPPSLRALEARAAALFAAADLRAGELRGLELRIEVTDDVVTYVERLRSSYAIAWATASSLADRFEAVLAVGSSTWTVASRVRQAQIYEALAASLSAAVVGPQVPPFILRDAVGNPVPPPPHFDADFDAWVERTLTGFAREQLEALECLAIRRYMFVRDTSVVSFETELAAARLASYSPQRRTLCLR